MADDQIFSQQVVLWPPDVSPQRLARLMESLEAYPEGKDIAQYAHDNHITIRFANRYNQDEYKVIQEDNAKFDPKTKTVLLNPEKTDDRLVSDIPHEVWHGDQESKGILNVLRQLKNPTQKLGVKIVSEAAAYTEQALDGVPLPKDETQVTVDGKTLQALRVAYDTAIKAHKTPEEARLDVFKAALKYESKFDDSQYIDIEKIGMAMEVTKSLQTDDAKRIVVASEGAELSNEKLTEVMRRAGNMTLSSGGGNFLSSLSDTDIIQLSTSQLSPRNKEALRETQGAYDEVRHQVVPPRSR
jgi:hypothetical protein